MAAITPLPGGTQCASTKKIHQQQQLFNKSKQQQLNNVNSSASSSSCNSALQIERGGGGKGATTTTTTTTTSTKPAPWVEGLKNSIASALAAALSKTILAPFDTIKTLQQYHQQTAGGSALSFRLAAKEILSRPNGFLNFYAGLGVSVVGAMPSVAMYFGTYSYFKKSLPNVIWLPGYDSEKGINDNKTLVIALSAALGNTFASFSRVPYEVLKQKLQTNTYRNTLEALKDITNIVDVFPKGGIAIQMLRDIPYAVVTLLLYENLQSYHRMRMEEQKEKEGKDNTGNNQASVDLVLGGLAGGMGSYVTNPFDVIKTRLQTAPPETYDGSIWKCTVDTFNEGGPMAFLRGSWPRLMHKIPANAFFFLFYEFFRRTLRCQN